MATSPLTSQELQYIRDLAAQGGTISADQAVPATSPAAALPPPSLDGAHVLWRAWAGDIPFGELPATEEADRLIFGFAVCKYDNGNIYRFTCNRHWKVVQDMDHGNEEDAKADIPTHSDASRVVWQPYEAKPE